MNIKKIFYIVLLIFVLLTSGFVIFKVPKIDTKVVNNNDRFNMDNTKKLNIVATNFASYDFVRAIAGDNVNLSFLIGPRKRCT